MKFDGINWRRSRTIVTLPQLHGGRNIMFGRICKQLDKGAVETNWKYSNGNPVFAKPITPNGWSLTNMMYGKDEIRYGEVRVRAYLQFNGLVYTASWVHEKKTMEYQIKQIQKRMENSNA